MRIRDQGGFTLLELIISITLMALIVTISLSGFRLANGSISKAEDKSEWLERLRSALYILDVQVQSILYLTRTQETEQINYIVGDEMSLQFVSNTSLWDRESGYVLVNYQIERDYNGKYNLTISEKVLEHDQGQLSTVLLKGMDKIYFEYLYAEPLQEEPRWHTSFKEKKGTPYIIRITLSEGTMNYVLNIPVRDFRKVE